jgi:Fe2+ or Zn2+ uptake regulation protein
MKSINLARTHHEIIQKEFSQVSRQTIYAALRYFNNSEVAQKIRARALELLQEEIKNNEEVNNVTT